MSIQKTANRALRGIKNHNPYISNNSGGLHNNNSQTVTGKPTNIKDYIDNAIDHQKKVDKAKRDKVKVIVNNDTDDANGNSTLSYGYTISYFDYHNGVEHSAKQYVDGSSKYGRYDNKGVNQNIYFLGQDDNPDKDNVGAYVSLNELFNMKIQINGGYQPNIKVTLDSKYKQMIEYQALMSGEKPGTLYYSIEAKGILTCPQISLFEHWIDNKTGKDKSAEIGRYGVYNFYNTNGGWAISLSSILGLVSFTTSLYFLIQTGSILGLWAIVRATSFYYRDVDDIMQVNSIARRFLIMGGRRVPDNEINDIIAPENENNRNNGEERHDDNANEDEHGEDVDYLSGETHNILSHTNKFNKNIKDFTNQIAVNISKREVTWKSRLQELDDIDKEYNKVGISMQMLDSSADLLLLGENEQDLETRTLLTKFRDRRNNCIIKLSEDIKNIDTILLDIQKYIEDTGNEIEKLLTRSIEIKNNPLYAKDFQDIGKNAEYEAAMAILHILNNEWHNNLDFIYRKLYRKYKITIDSLLIKHQALYPTDEVYEDYFNDINIQLDLLSEYQPYINNLINDNIINAKNKIKDIIEAINSKKQQYNDLLKQKQNEFIEKNLNTKTSDEWENSELLVNINQRLSRLSQEISELTNLLSLEIIDENGINVFTNISNDLILHKNEFMKIIYNIRQKFELKKNNITDTLINDYELQIYNLDRKINDFINGISIAFAQSEDDINDISSRINNTINSKLDDPNSCGFLDSNIFEIMSLEADEKSMLINQTLAEIVTDRNILKSIISEYNLSIIKLKEFIELNSFDFSENEDLTMAYEEISNNIKKLIQNYVEILSKINKNKNILISEYANNDLKPTFKFIESIIEYKSKVVSELSRLDFEINRILNSPYEKINDMPLESNEQSENNDAETAHRQKVINELIKRKKILESQLIKIEKISNWGSYLFYKVSGEINQTELLLNNDDIILSINDNLIQTINEIINDINIANNLNLDAIKLKINIQTLEYNIGSKKIEINDTYYDYKRNLEYYFKLLYKLNVGEDNAELNHIWETLVSLNDKYNNKIVELDALNNELKVLKQELNQIYKNAQLILLKDFSNIQGFDEEFIIKLNDIKSVVNNIGKLNDFKSNDIEIKNINDFKTTTDIINNENAPHIKIRNCRFNTKFYDIFNENNQFIKISINDFCRFQTEMIGISNAFNKKYEEMLLVKNQIEKILLISKSDTLFLKNDLRLFNDYLNSLEEYRDKYNKCNDEIINIRKQLNLTQTNFLKVCEKLSNELKIEIQNKSRYFNNIEDINESNINDFTEDKIILLKKIEILKQSLEIVEQANDSINTNILEENPLNSTIVIANYISAKNSLEEQITKLNITTVTNHSIEIEKIKSYFSDLKLFLKNKKIDYDDILIQQKDEIYKTIEWINNQTLSLIQNINENPNGNFEDQIITLNNEKKKLQTCILNFDKTREELETLVFYFENILNENINTKLNQIFHEMGEVIVPNFTEFFNSIDLIYLNGWLNTNPDLKEVYNLIMDYKGLKKKIIFNISKLNKDINVINMNLNELAVLDNFIIDDSSLEAINSFCLRDNFEKGELINALSQDVVKNKSDLLDLYKILQKNKIDMRNVDNKWRYYRNYIHKNNKSLNSSNYGELEKSKYMESQNLCLQYDKNLLFRRVLNERLNKLFVIYKNKIYESQFYQFNKLDENGYIDNIINNINKINELLLKREKNIFLFNDDSEEVIANISAELKKLLFIVNNFKDDYSKLSTFINNSIQSDLGLLNKITMNQNNLMILNNHIEEIKNILHEIYNPNDYLDLDNAELKNKIVNNLAFNTLTGILHMLVFQNENAFNIFAEVKEINAYIEDFEKNIDSFSFEINESYVENNIYKEIIEKAIFKHEQRLQYLNFIRDLHLSNYASVKKINPKTASDILLLEDEIEKNKLIILRLKKDLKKVEIKITDKKIELQNYKLTFLNRKKIELEQIKSNKINQIKENLENLKNENITHNHYNNENVYGFDFELYDEFLLERLSNINNSIEEWAIVMKNSSDSFYNQLLFLYDYEINMIDKKISKELQNLNELYAQEDINDTEFKEIDLNIKLFELVIQQENYDKIQEEIENIVLNIHKDFDSFTNGRNSKYSKLIDKERDAVSKINIQDYEINSLRNNIDEIKSNFSINCSKIDDVMPHASSLGVNSLKISNFLINKYFEYKALISELENEIISLDIVSETSKAKITEIEVLKSKIEKNMNIFKTEKNIEICRKLMSENLMYEKEIAVLENELLSLEQSTNSLKKSDLFSQIQYLKQNLKKNNNLIENEINNIKSYLPIMMKNEEMLTNIEQDVYEKINHIEYYINSNITLNDERINDINAEVFNLRETVKNNIKQYREKMGSSGAHIDTLGRLYEIFDFADSRSTRSLGLRKDSNLSNVNENIIEYEYCLNNIKNWIDAEKNRFISKNKKVIDDSNNNLDRIKTRIQSLSQIDLAKNNIHSSNHELEQKFSKVEIDECNMHREALISLRGEIEKFINENVDSKFKAIQNHSKVISFKINLLTSDDLENNDYGIIKTLYIDCFSYLLHFRNELVLSIHDIDVSILEIDKIIGNYKIENPDIAEDSEKSLEDTSVHSLFQLNQKSSLFSAKSETNSNTSINSGLNSLSDFSNNSTASLDDLNCTLDFSNIEVLENEWNEIMNEKDFADIEWDEGVSKDNISKNAKPEPRNSTSVNDTNSDVYNGRSQRKLYVYFMDKLKKINEDLDITINDVSEFKISQNLSINNTCSNSILYFYTILLEIKSRFNNIEIDEVINDDFNELRLLSDNDLIQAFRDHKNKIQELSNYIEDENNKFIDILAKKSHLLSTVIAELKNEFINDEIIVNERMLQEFDDNIRLSILEIENTLDWLQKNIENIQSELVWDIEYYKNIFNNVMDLDISEYGKISFQKNNIQKLKEFAMFLLDYHRSFVHHFDSRLNLFQENFLAQQNTISLESKVVSNRDFIMKLNTIMMSKLGLSNDSILENTITDEIVNFIDRETFVNDTKYKIKKINDSKLRIDYLINTENKSFNSLILDYENRLQLGYKFILNSLEFVNNEYVWTDLNERIEEVSLFKKAVYNERETTTQEIKKIQLSLDKNIDFIKAEYSILLNDEHKTLNILDVHLRKEIIYKGYNCIKNKFLCYKHIIDENLNSYSELANRLNYITDPTEIKATQLKMAYVMNKIDCIKAKLNLDIQKIYLFNEKYFSKDTLMLYKECEILSLNDFKSSVNAPFVRASGIYINPFLYDNFDAMLDCLYNMGTSVKRNSSINETKVYRQLCTLRQGLGLLEKKYKKLLLTLM